VGKFVAAAHATKKIRRNNTQKTDEVAFEVIGQDEETRRDKTSSDDMSLQIILSPVLFAGRLMVGWWDVYY